jgi:hypothetical protein
MFINRINMEWFRLLKMKSKDSMFVHKSVSGSYGSVGVVKGVKDTIVSISCGDNICATVSLVGVISDSITVTAACTKGNISISKVTVPLSLLCKTFVGVSRGDDFFVEFAMQIIKGHLLYNPDKIIE